MANKINEIIESINSGLDPAEVLRIVRTELENYYTKEEVDDLIASIDLSPYYTKTEVDAIVSRIDDDVDAVEGRMDTAEGDINNLEQSKQDVLTPVNPIQIEIEDGVKKLKLNGFEILNSVNWFTELFDVVVNGQNTEYYFKYDTVLCLRGLVDSVPVPKIFFPKGLRYYNDEDIYIYLTGSYELRVILSDIFSNGSSHNISGTQKGVWRNKPFQNLNGYYNITDSMEKYSSIYKIDKDTSFVQGTPSGSINFMVMVR